MSEATSWVQEADALLRAAYPAGEPGAAVIVARDGRPILRQGYGLANLEWGIPLQPDMVLRLGSMTKQFTAVAILMLLEEGKVGLNDPLVRFLPDYPDPGQAITVEHLLTHTSGIRNMTELPSWPTVWRKDFTLPELIAYFAEQPAQFAPGTHWAYSNSGYILLGAIIEKTSGLSYAQFIQQRIFEPLGMRRSTYDETRRIIPRRVAGYERGDGGYANADYLSMTQPHAAGGLASTVDDLLLWDTALYGEQLLRQDTLQRAFVPYRLADGTPAGYGYGWAIREYAGHRVIEHGGGIHGFRTAGLRLPDDRIYVTVLSNNTAGSAPDELAQKLAALAIGQPYQEPAIIALPPDLLARYVGVYQDSGGVDSVIVCEEGQLLVQAGPRQMELLAIAPDEFVLKEARSVRLRFLTDAAGVAIASELRRGYGPPEVARKKAKPS